MSQDIRTCFLRLTRLHHTIKSRFHEQSSVYGLLKTPLLKCHSERSEESLHLHTQPVILSRRLRISVFAFFVVIPQRNGGICFCLLLLACPVATVAPPPSMHMPMMVMMPRLLH